MFPVQIYFRHRNDPVVFHFATNDERQKLIKGVNEAINLKTNMVASNADGVFAIINGNDVILVSF